MFKKILFTIILLSGVANAKEELNIYSSRHYDVDAKIIQEFTKQTGIKVNVLNDNTHALLKKLEIEGSKTPDDLIITADAVGPYSAKEMGLLTTIDSDFINSVVPNNLKDKDNQVIPFTKRVRVIVYNIHKVKPSDLSTYEDLASAKWKGRILQRPSNNSYNEFLLSSIIARNGEEEALKWVKGIVSNMARDPKGGDRDQFRAIAQGQGDLTLANTYYLGLMLNSKDEADRKVASDLKIFFPNQKTSGAHINVSSAGVIKYSKNKENAVKFIEFLLSKQIQEQIANVNYEYPVNINVPLTETLKSFGSFKEDTQPLENVVKHQQQAVKLFNVGGWK